MLKITRLSNLVLKMFKPDDNKVVEIGGKVYKMVKNLFKSKKSINKKFKNLTYIRAIEKHIFLISNTKKTFNYLKQACIKASIF